MRTFTYRSTFLYGLDHKLNMEVDIQRLFGPHVTWCAQLYSLAETPQTPPPSPPQSPCIGTRIRGRYWSAKIDDISLYPPGSDIQKTLRGHRNELSADRLMKTIGRRKIRLIEGSAKCRYLKKLICKGTLRQVFIYLRPRTPYTPPLTHCIRVYSLLINMGKGEGWRVEPVRRL
jgi:hypothetical protein